jgi:hypothetical protein
MGLLGAGGMIGASVNAGVLGGAVRGGTVLVGTVGAAVLLFAWRRRSLTAASA